MEDTAFDFDEAKRERGGIRDDGVRGDLASAVKNMNFHAEERIG